MSERSDNYLTDVALIRADNPIESLVKGFDILGGINRFIQENDHVFIKITLKLPYGYPTNINYDTLGKIIDLCQDAGAKQVYVGDYPVDYTKSELIGDITGLKTFIESKGAMFTNLDMEEKFPTKEILLENKKVNVPSVILNADKFIIINQINVDPLFICTLSYLNTYSIISKRYQKIHKNEMPEKEYLYQDQYKQNLISHILAISDIKPPNLVINDLFYILDGAGPLIYKDSRCKKTNLIVMGENAFAVDYVTLKLMDIDISESELLLKAQKHQFGISNLNKINILGENISDAKIQIRHCVNELEDINVKNCFPRIGRYCSGCYSQAYHLLNFLKSSMIKDLKYMGYFSFLIGDNPPEPDLNSDIMIFGDCAISSTKDRSYRKLKKQKKQKMKKKITKRLKNQQPPSSKKNKIVDNKHILEFPGCPPDLNKCCESLIKYYGKANLPNLSLLDVINKSFIIDKN